MFIVNPAAGKGRAKEMAQHIRERFEHTSEHWHLEMTERPGHATHMAHSAANMYPELRVYAVGGDGTVNEVVNGLVGTTAALGIIPCGSGNDTLRSVTDITDPYILLEAMLNATPQKFDVGCVNKRYFINIASVGLDAEVVRLTRRYKKIPLVPGPTAYLLGVLTALVRLKTWSVKIGLDHQKMKRYNLLLAAFANGRFYGGGMQPVPSASMQDGQLHLCTVDRMTRFDILKFLPRFRKGKHTQMKQVHITPFRDLVLKSESALPVNIDGELFHEKEVHITVVPDALQLLVP